MLLLLTLSCVPMFGMEPENLHVNVIYSMSRTYARNRIVLTLRKAEASEPACIKSLGGFSEKVIKRALRDGSARGDTPDRALAHWDTTALCQPDMEFRVRTDQFGTIAPETNTFHTCVTLAKEGAEGAPLFSAMVSLNIFKRGLSGSSSVTIHIAEKDGNFSINPPPTGVAEIDRVANTGDSHE